MKTTATQEPDMTIQKTEFPDTKLTTNERFQLAAGFAINNVIARILRSLGR